MNISQVGIDLIKSFEGFEDKAYKCPAGVWTIGFGHTGNVKEGQTITRSDAEHLLRNDLQRYVDGVSKCLKVTVNQNQFDALVSFAYNCGVGALQKSLMLTLINAKEFTKAAKEFEKFVHSGGKVLPGLVRRRKAEQELFLKPITKPANKVAESAVTMWKGRPLVKGQKGLLTIIKPINVYKRVGNKLETVRVAKVGEVLPVFEYDETFYKAAGQYRIEGNLWITNMQGFVKYETPSKSLLEKANSL